MDEEYSLAAVGVAFCPTILSRFVVCSALLPGEMQIIYRAEIMATIVALGVSLSVKICGDNQAVIDHAAKLIIIRDSGRTVPRHLARSTSEPLNPV